ncbi:uncharacterized protein [Arachis hypogaea]|uniref:uncharacterized protein n=1 Tax=Arachis hypogaea TaxID=3818 RepID=UPI000DEDFF3C|nr:uncharacterized protein LOC112770130 [Arachis hypogaea]
MTCSLPNLSLAPFDSEIERTLLHIRQAWRWLDFEEGEKVFTNSPTISPSSNEGPNYSSVDTTNSSSFDLGVDNMAAPRRVTLKEAGAPEFVLQPLHVLHPNLNANFKLKTALINLLPKFHGLPAQDPIRHLKDFHGVCLTTRREGSDKVAIWLFAFPFSLKGRAKEWFYTLPSDVVSNWDLLRREFHDKFMPVEMTDKLRKEISCIVQGEMETLYEYWKQFHKLLDSCSNHMIDIQVLLSYVCQGMRKQDKNLLDASSNALIARMEPPSTSTPQAPNSSAIPSQPLPRPKGGINTVTLRSETQLKERDSKAPSPMIVTQEENEFEIEEIEEEEEAHLIVEDEDPQPRSKVPREEQVLEEVARPIPFPTLARKAKKHVELDQKMVEMFKKVEVTIPLFAKFLKDLCMNKDRIHELETIPLWSSISALMGATPEKCVDPGPCLVQFIDCMCDLGACVSIMPLSVYHMLKLPPLKRSAARIVLADKSIITVTGIAEDVLVNIKGLIFPIDFHILEMPPSESERTSSILLWRPFLRTSRFKLDVHSGTYSFEIYGRVVSFISNEAPTGEPFHIPV